MLFYCDTGKSKLNLCDSHSVSTGHGDLLQTQAISVACSPQPGCGAGLPRVSLNSRVASALFCIAEWAPDPVPKLNKLLVNLERTERASPLGKAFCFLQPYKLERGGFGKLREGGLEARGDPFLGIVGLSSLPLQTQASCIHLWLHPQLPTSAPLRN